MMGSGMMLGKIVSAIEDAFFPVDVELALADAIADPIEAHVNGFGALLLHGVVGDAGSGAVVSDNGRGWLRMAEFFEADA